jgi:hypothetical protein
MTTDRLTDLIDDAFKATCEAEKIAAAGPRGQVYHDLLEAHSALLRAKNHYPINKQFDLVDYYDKVGSRR